MSKINKKALYPPIGRKKKSPKHVLLEALRWVE
jgi:hypothetical protein